MEVILDTNFIISCVKRRIDFLGELEGLGFKVKIPREVLQEMKDLKKGNTSHEERTAIDIAFRMFEEKDVKKIKIGGRGVDYGLVKKGSDGTYIATLDREIKHKIANRVVIDSAKNCLKVERD